MRFQGPRRQGTTKLSFSPQLIKLLCLVHVFPIIPRLLSILSFHYISHNHRYQNNVHFEISLSSNKKRGLRYSYASLTLPQTALEHLFHPNPSHITATQEPLANFTPNQLLQPLQPRTWSIHPPNPPSPIPLFLSSQLLPRRTSPYILYHSTTNAPSAAAS